MSRRTTLLVSMMFLATVASAQSQGIGVLYEANLPGDASLPRGALNIGATISATDGEPDPFEPLQISSAVHLPNGHYIICSTAVVSTDPMIPNPTSRHLFYEIDADGTVLATINQPAFANLDPRGLQDLGWDQDTSTDSLIWSGTDGRAIVSFDWHTGSFGSLISFTEHGIKVLSGWQGNSIWCCTVADIDGQKVLVTADSPNPDFVNGPPFAGRPTNWHLIQTPAVGVPPGEEFTQFAKFRNSTPDPTDPDILGQFNQDAGKFGLAFDPVNNTLWYAVDEPFANPNPIASALRFIEMDIDGNRTGKVYQAPRSIGEFGGAQGDIYPLARGCEMYVDADGSLVMLFVGAILGGSSREILVEVNGGFQFGTSCGGDIGYVSEPYVGNLDDFQITLENAPPNPLGAAFLFRNSTVPEPGLQIPGINNCPLLLSLGNLRSMGDFTLVNGAASFHQVLPDDQGLVGVEVGFQWLLPSGLAVLPLNLSAAGVLRLGENQ